MFNCFENCMEASTKVLMGNIDTVATHSKVLQMYTTANQSLTEQWTTAPVCALADPDLPWNPGPGGTVNPYVPTGYTYNVYGGATSPANYGDDLADPTQPYNAYTNPFVPEGCTYNPNGGATNPANYGDLSDPTQPYNPTNTSTDPSKSNQNLFVEPAGYEAPQDGSDTLDQVNMVNGFNTTGDPDSMNDFLITYDTGQYIDSWSSAFGTTVLNQSELNASGDQSGTASSNLTLITSMNNLVSSSAQEEEGTGQNEAKTMNSVIQEDSNNQQTIADWLSPIQDIESSLAALSV